MKKKFNFSVILPMIYPALLLLYFLFWIITGLVRGEALPSAIDGFLGVPSEGIPIIAMLIGNIIALIIVAVWDLHIGKHIPLYIGTIIAFVVAFIISWLTGHSGIILPMAVLIAGIIVFHMKVNDTKERATMLLSNPIIYFPVYVWASFAFPIIIVD